MERVRWLGGWVGVILIGLLAVASEAGGGIPWVRKLGWTLVALLAVHAAWLAWTE